MTQRGSLDTWTQLASTLFAAGCEGQSLAVIASFASPLMSMICGNEGGAVLSIATNAERFGRGGVFAGCASVWGAREEIDLPASESPNPAIYDRIETRDPQIVFDFIEKWTRTEPRIMLTCPNSSLVDMIEHYGNKAVSKRILEVRLDLPPTVFRLQGKRLEFDLLSNCGHAGPVFMEWVTANWTWTRTALEQYTREIFFKTKLPPEARWVVRMAAAMAVAAIVVSKLGLLEFSPSRIITWMIERVHRVALPTDDSWAMRMTGEYLEKSIPNTLVMERAYSVHDKQEPVVFPLRNITVRYELETSRYILAVQPFRSWCTIKRVRFGDLWASLRESGVAEIEYRTMTLAAGTHYKNKKSVEVMIIDADHYRITRMVPKWKDVQAILDRAQSPDTIFTNPSEASSA